MKTAIQELIEWCNSCLTDKTMSEGGRIALEVTIVRANDLLEKEKEQIIEAYEDGKQNGMESITNVNAYIIGEYYYKETYGEQRINIRISFKA